MTAHTPYDEVSPAVMWQVVLVSAVAEFMIFGIRLSYQVFQSQFVNVEGWSSQDAASVFSVAMLTFALCSAPAGALLDRHGPKIVFTSGAVILGVGLLLSSRVAGLGQLRLTYGVIGGMGLAVVGLGPIAGNIAAFVPPAQRGRAIGFAFAGTGFGSMVFIPLSSWVMGHFGWRNTFLVHSLVSLLILAPLLFFGLKNPPKHPAPKPTALSGKKQAPWKALVRNPLFWVMMLVSLTALGPLRSLTVHQLAYLEQNGFQRTTAASYVGLAGLLTFVTFIGWGWVSDRYGRTLAFTGGALGLSGAVGMLFIIGQVRVAPLLLIYALLYALGEGTRSSQTTALASDIFQKNGLGLVNGLVGGMFGAGAAFGPWFVGLLRDCTGSYTLGFVAVLVMIAVSVVGFVYIALNQT